jgi:hypothetical protein
VSNIIPLRLTMTSASLEALDLVRTAPDVIDVRMFKVMGFGEQGKIIKPFSLMNRSFYHRTDLVAGATWELDGHPKELPSEARSPPRWHIELKGNLKWNGIVKLGPSFEGENMVLRVCGVTLVEISCRLMSFIVHCLPLHIPCASANFPPCRQPTQATFHGQHSPSAIALLKTLFIYPSYRIDITMENRVY